MGKITDIELALGQQPASVEEGASDGGSGGKCTLSPTALQPEVINLCSDDSAISISAETPVPEKEEPAKTAYVRQIVWLNVIKLGTLHLFGLSAPLLVPFAHSATVVFMFFLSFLTLLGVQVGAHRLWAHRSFKANVGVRLFLCLCHSMSMQNDLYEWVRDHRVHHKWSDTDADPHNATRSFFFSHMGWLMVKKHPEVLRKGATLDLSDLTDDPVIMFQRRYIVPLVIIFWALLPTLIPVLVWGECALVAFFICVLMRYLLTLHVTWLVNSWAHMFGSRPYNSRLVPVEASIRHVLVGEGFHNYHHQFPWDYSASELGPLDVFNPATVVINLFARLGWAWDLKKPHPTLVERTVEATGDRSLLYSRSLLRSAWEWTTGLAIMTCPLWGLLLWKYLFLHFYFMHFDHLPALDVPSLWAAFLSAVQYAKTTIIKRFTEVKRRSFDNL